MPKCFTLIVLYTTGTLTPPAVLFTEAGSFRKALLRIISIERRDWSSLSIALFPLQNQKSVMMCRLLTLPWVVLSWERVFAGSAILKTE